jgi:hypothetical protein
VKIQFLFRWVIVVAILGSSWVSCAPKAHVSEEKMIDLMCDVIILEAGNQIKYNYANLPDSMWQSHYNFVCKKHQVPYEDFELELLRLKADPEAFTVLMEKVITQMQMAELNARKGKK